MGNVRVEVREELRPSGERLFAVLIDSVNLGRVNLPGFYAPCLALIGSKLFLWGGTRLAIVDTASSNLDLISVQDELQSVYSVNGGWCLVGETSVATFSALGDTAISQYLHDEVIVRSRVEDSRVLLEDFVGNHLSIEIGAQLNLGPADEVGGPRENRR